MTFREKYGVQIAFWMIFVCILALFGIWIPRSSQKDNFRTLVVHQPPLGHFLYQADELKAIRKEVVELPDQVHAQIGAGTYTPQQHFQNMRRLMYIEKSLLPVSGGAYAHGVIPYASGVEGFKPSGESVQLLRDMQVQLQQASNNLTADFARAGLTDKETFADLSRQAGLLELSLQPIVESDYHWGRLAAWALETHLKSMLVVFILFLIRAELVGQRRRILIYDAPKTAFWMFFWPVGIWKYPTDDALEFARILRHRLALAFSFLFAMAPSFAVAQSGDSGQQKREDNHTLVLGAEGVNRYVGQAVGEIFANEPAPRIWANYSLKSQAGSFSVSNWDSFGRGYNLESDLGVSYSRSGLTASYTHLFIRGGDVSSLGVAWGHSWGRMNFGASLDHYFRISGSSPPTGTVAKASMGFGHNLPLGFAASYRFTLGLDDNPFGLGHGLTSMGFGKAEIRHGNVYFDWNASIPVAGKGNTSRGFRQSVAFGLTHQFSW